MKILVDRKALASALGLAAKVSRQPARVTLRAERDGTSELVAEGSCMLRLNLAGRADRSGEVAFSVDDVLQLLRKMVAHSFVTLELPAGSVSGDRSRLLLYAGSVRAEVSTQEIVPETPVDSIPQAVRLEGPAFAQAMSLLAPVAVKDTARYGITQIFLHGTPSGVRAVATDGASLLCFDLAGTVTREAYVASHVVAWLGPWLSGARKLGEVCVSLSTEAGSTGYRGSVSWDGGSVVYTTDGSFPAYRGVVPSNPPRCSVYVDSEALAAALERCAVVANIARLDLTDGVLRVSARSPTESVHEDLQVDVSGGEFRTTGLTPAVSLPVIRAMGPGRRIDFREVLGPIICEVPEGLGIIMPARLE